MPTLTETPMPGASQQGGNRPSNRGSSTATSSRGRKSSTSTRGGKSASAARGGNQTASGGPIDLPSERAGAGDGQSWFDQSIQEAAREEGGSQGPPYPIGPAPATRGALSQIYGAVTGKTPPPANIASEALRAYYSGVEASMINTWACQVLCMITEYHMACVTRGAPVTSPILPGIIEDKLPLLGGYSPPEDREGVMDVRMRDHFTKTLRVAVWLHRLDMALSNELATSGCLVQGRHYVGHLLSYFLAPGTAWDLHSKDVIDQVLKENRAHNKRRRREVASSLKKCLNQRATLQNELDAVAKALEVTPPGQSHLKMEERVHTIRTALLTVEHSISKFENAIEECHILEDEAHLVEEEETSLDQPDPEGEIADVEMVNQEEQGDPESSGPQVEADTEDHPPQASEGNVMSPEEENALLADTPQLGESSPRSETAGVSWELVGLQLTSPARPEMEEGEAT